MQLSLSPSNPQIAQGTAAQFTVRGLFQNGHRTDLTQAVRYSVSGPDGSPVATVEQGLVQLEQPGRYQVRVDYQGQAVTTSITVTAAKLTSLSLSPKTPEVAKGLSQAFTATAGFSDGTSQNVTALSTWSAKDLMGTGVVLLSSKGVAAAKNIGESSITVRYKTLSASTTMQVTAATLSTLTLSPNNPTLAVGGSLTFDAQGTFTDGTVQDVTAAADWGVTDLVGSGVASIDGATVVADSAGQATVSVFYEGLEADTTLTVTAVTLTALAISPTNPTVALGASQQFTATGTYSDGSTQNLTSLVSWTATDIAPAVDVASIDEFGLATGNQAGQSLITASYMGLGASTTLTVAAGPGSWVSQTSGTTVDLIDVWGSDVNNIWAVSDNSTTILKWNGSAWAATTAPTGINFQGVWGSSANNVWAVGESGTIVNFNGTTWTAQMSGSAAWLLGVWGTDANNVWAVGSAGTILKWNGTVWTTQTSGTSSDLDRVWGVDANHIWAVADDGTIQYFNGTAWANQPSGNTQTLTGVWGTDPNNVWAVGTTGTILKWNGTTWAAQASGFTEQVVRVWGTDVNNVWAVGYSGTILKWNGSSWTTQTSGSTNTLTGVWGTDANHIWIVGYLGTILQWQP
jgi:hypothetical protein